MGSLGSVDPGGDDSGVNFSQPPVHVMVPPGPTNPPLPPDPTPPPVPVVDVSQTTWGSPRPSSFGHRQVTGVPLWVSDPHVSHVTTVQNVQPTQPTGGGNSNAPGGLTTGDWDSGVEL